MTTTKEHWGPWVLEGLGLVIHTGEIAEYPFDLLNGTDSAQVLGWIYQLAGRFGGTADGNSAVGEFAVALYDQTPEAEPATVKDATTLASA